MATNHEPTAKAEVNTSVIDSEIMFLKKLDAKFYLVGLEVQDIRSYSHIYKALVLIREDIQHDIAHLIYQRGDTRKTYADRILELIEEEQNKEG
jgi:hypothetical protein